MTGQTRFNGEAVGGTFTPTLRAGIVAPAAWACKPLWGLMDVMAGALRLPALQKPVMCCVTAGALTLTRPTKTGHVLRDG
ncbi:hypothetical protein ACSHJY_001028, partial [Cronobacter sakazakii]